MTITRIKNNGDLQITDEIIEYLSELEGGRNHLRNTGVGNSESISMFGSPMLVRAFSFSTGADYYTLESTASYVEAYYRAIEQGTVPSELSGTWTFSGEVLIPEGTSGVPLTRSQVAIHSPIAWVNSYGNGERLINATKGIWTKFVHTFEIPEGTQSAHLGIKFRDGTQVPGDKIHFKNFKLERGTKATDWTPAPGDLGMDYPNDIQHFSTGFRSNGKILVRELIEGENFSFSTDKKIYLNKLEEGVVLDG